MSHLVFMISFSPFSAACSILQATAHLVRSFPQPDQGNGNQCFSVPKATTSRGNNLDYESSFDLDNSSCYQNYGMGETYSRQNVEGSSSIFGAASDLYRSSIIRPPPVGSARASFPYNAPPPHFSGAGDPRGFQQVPRAPSFCPSPLAPPHGKCRDNITVGCNF